VKRSFIYRAFAVLILSVFFAAQSYSLAHASVYGDDPHEHDGVACVIGVLVQDDLGVLPVTEPFVRAPIAPPPAPDTVFESRAYTSPQGRAPPPRSPPLIS